MKERTHDPSEYIRGLQQLLISDKKKIGFLFGAGTSLARKNEKSIYIPAIGKMTTQIESELSKTEKYKIALAEIRQEIGTDKYNIETLLSNLEEKRHIIGKGILNGLNSDDLNALITETKNQIRLIVCVHKQIIENSGLENLIHVDFAEWIGKADRKSGIDIFTTNYDYFFELGMEEKNIPYYDGFSGSLKPFFFSESVDDLGYLPKQTKLWKIHGSLGWHLDVDVNKNVEKVWRKDSDCDDILIYPSTLKYADSKKQPYVALMDRLTNFLRQPDTILIVCGYSFNDFHINERILTALKTNTSAHVYALYYDACYDDDGKKIYSLTENSSLTKICKANGKISVFGCRNAVIGCQYGKWKLEREPDIADTISVNLYFDEDGPSNIDDPKAVDLKGKVSWTGEGELTLPDFSKFVTFLQSMIYQNNTKRGQDE